MLGFDGKCGYGCLGNTDDGSSTDMSLSYLLALEGISFLPRHLGISGKQSAPNWLHEDLFDVQGLVSAPCQRSIARFCRPIK